MDINNRGTSIIMTTHNYNLWKSIKKIYMYVKEVDFIKKTQSEPNLSDAF
ncbi:MAG: hypothetical protein Ct9H90mP3_4700 [Flammeovirgaceae bacterium]|nr:MAG: hypothetical protein Ct9H90mP3_4700 [Flammeovirgaceae bacterium]